MTLTILKHLMPGIEAAEQLDSDAFEAEYVQLDNGRELLLVAVTGENLDGLAMVMEGLRMSTLEATRQRTATSVEYPFGSTVKLRHRHFDESCIGWAHRGDDGGLLSAHGRTPLDPDAWIVIEEKEAS
ncbi:hypothetical protein [Stutzerimonas kirkiae]|uniref:hypothetical protein n=1 Tax=Stutzerimonas kirkiae TaxID=2211392 RepID=UPI0010382FF9|nr:hypothetical protein [Stutzerimonas kirkiae]TBV10224.1 hypothetical protein DNK08_07025 [Stutzerimonas kirkiae]